MATVTEIRAGLADAIRRNVPALRAYPTVPDSFVTPAAMVFGPERIRYDSTMARGSDEYRLILRVYVGRVDEKGAQDKLDAYISGQGSQSIKLAIEADASLGGVVDFARVEEARNYGPYQSGQSSYLGVEFVVFVIARPS